MLLVVPLISSHVSFSEYLRSISLPVPVVVEDTSSSSEYGSVSPDNDLHTNPFIFKPSVKCYSERDVKGPRSLFLRYKESRRIVVACCYFKWGGGAWMKQCWFQ